METGTTDGDSVADTNCRGARTIFAVNLNGEKHTDAAGIVFQAGSSIQFSDPHKLQRTAALPPNGVPQRDSALYGTYIWGSPPSSGSSGNCITLNVPVGKIDGKYELAIKATDMWNHEKGKKSFNIRFNDVPVIQEVDIVALTGSYGYGIDFLINFEITNGGNILQLLGHIDTIIKDPQGYIPLSFCLGNCGYPDSSFIASAISVLKFEKAAPSSTPPPPPEIAVVARSDTPTCARGMDMNCDNLHFSDKQCPRENVYYGVDSSTLCYNTQVTTINSSACSKWSTILAVNLNGETFKDARGIEYQAGSQVSFKDPARIRKVEGINNSIRGVPKNEQDLYRTFVTAYPEKDPVGKCLSYRIPIQKDGSYELTVKSFENIYDDARKRVWSFFI